MSSFRFMRVIVFFDLPTETLEDKRNYRHFRKSLIKNGFVMMQESVYVKLLTTKSVEKSVKNMLNKNRPAKGIVQSILVTEKQFSDMDFICGEYKSELLDTTDRLVIL